jgi:hypothetical protein
MRNLWGWGFTITYLAMLSIVFLFGRAPEKKVLKVEIANFSGSRMPSSKKISSRFVLPVW